jgi:hypothetical protein
MKSPKNPNNALLRIFFGYFPQFNINILNNTQKVATIIEKNAFLFLFRLFGTFKRAFSCKNTQNQL